MSKRKPTSYYCKIIEEAEKLRSAGAKYGGSSASTSSANGGTPTTSAPPSSLDGGPSSKKRKMETAPASEHGMPMKYIKFGTNVDLSDENKFKAQLHVRVFDETQALSSGIGKDASILSTNLRLKYALTSWPHRPRNEHCSIVHEGMEECLSSSSFL